MGGYFEFMMAYFPCETSDLEANDSLETDERELKLFQSESNFSSKSQTSLQISELYSCI